ncbi:MAG: type II toxin-antitoxin system RelE/ParE family toxin [Elusimicrobia bacterium]|nr:type II toxin-antitoxin system RelE/ParE family toxin [Elusimicrobiota bacterium]
MSADYRVFETADFQKGLRELPGAIPAKIAGKLKVYVYPALRLQPHFGPNIRKLRSWKPETWRYRIGRWRFFYEIDEPEKIVYMIALHQRKDAYH